nr:MAG TPA: hypothetical protein [Caudoviricetes sp.]
MPTRLTGCLGRARVVTMTWTCTGQAPTVWAATA